MRAAGRFAYGEPYGDKVTKCYVLVKEKMEGAGDFFRLASVFRSKGREECRAEARRYIRKRANWKPAVRRTKRGRAAALRKAAGKRNLKLDTRYSIPDRSRGSNIKHRSFSPASTFRCSRLQHLPDHSRHISQHSRASQRAGAGTVAYGQTPHAHALTGQNRPPVEAQTRRTIMTKCIFVIVEGISLRNAAKRTTVK
jgi:hypothetical protein